MTTIKLNPQEFGCSGETVTMDVGDALPCFEIGAEYPFHERLGLCESIDRENGRATLRFQPTFFRVEEVDGEEAQIEVKDDMAGTLTCTVMEPEGDE